VKTFVVYRGLLHWALGVSWTSEEMINEATLHFYVGCFTVHFVFSSKHHLNSYD